ncbi:hypothetical protein GALMADRAFT_235350 [Galerina marginata CBS 339.88]|uniref:Uncharacterized protein n=1 Tax=Galerina marginata (strain CBS 339.88) TaxID=685588 RepID=A0A067U3T4_GALM3|nr:hypothetical protein GALMADRAFT_235350 [Galerina marginata CBS 339.88]
MDNDRYTHYHGKNANYDDDGGFEKYSPYEGHDGQKWYGGEEGYYPEEAYQDDAQYQGANGFYDAETSFFDGASGFVLDGGNFSSVGGAYYGYSPEVQETAHTAEPQSSSQSQSTSYFRNSSNFRIISGNFMIVGGNFYDYNLPASPKTGPRNDSRAAPKNTPDGHRRGQDSGSIPYTNMEYRREKDARRSRHPEQTTSARNQSAGGTTARRRDGRGVKSRFTPEAPGHQPLAQNDSDKTIPSITITKSQNSHPNMPVDDTSDKEVLSTKIRSVTAQIGGLSIGVSSERSSFRQAPSKPSAHRGSSKVRGPLSSVSQDS